MSKRESENSVFSIWQNDSLIDSITYMIVYIGIEPPNECHYSVFDFNFITDAKSPS